MYRITKTAMEARYGVVFKRWGEICRYRWSVYERDINVDGTSEAAIASRGRHRAIIAVTTARKPQPMTHITVLDGARSI